MESLFILHSEKTGLIIGRKSQMVFMGLPIISGMLKIDAEKMLCLLKSSIADLEIKPEPQLK